MSTPTVKSIENPHEHTAFSVDPGLDEAAVVFWKWDAQAPPPNDFAARLRSYSGHFRIRTGTRTELLRRAQTLAQEMHRLCVSWRPQGVWLEVPSKTGAYQRNRGLSRAMAGGLAKLNLSIGALVAGAVLADVPVHPVTSALPKHKRQELLEAQARHAGIVLPRGKRGAILEDVWDALYLGVLNVWG